MSVADIKQGIAPNRAFLEFAAWLRHMRQALRRPDADRIDIMPNALEQRIDRDLSRIRLLSGDPRI